MKICKTALVFAKDKSKTASVKLLEATGELGYQEMERFRGKVICGCER